MKIWKNLMAGLCVAAMAGSMAMPVCAAEEADSEAADVTEAMLGLWQDAVGDVYGFYADYSFFGQWMEEGEDVVGGYSLVADADNMLLTIDFNTGDEPVAFYVVPNEEENMLELYDMDGEPFSALIPYESPVEEGEEDYNILYQTMGQELTACYMGTTEADETFIYAENEDGSYCSVIVVDAEDNYVSFVGPGTFDEENHQVTITDDISEMRLTFDVAVDEDGKLYLGLGDLGSATLEEAVIANAVQAMKFCEEYGTPVN